MNYLQTGTGANFATPADRTLFNNQIRQANSARLWVLNTYINGASPAVLDPAAPRRPGPPGPNGEGLVQLVAQWQASAAQNQAKQNQILDYIINFIITKERPFQTAYEQRTAYAKSQPVDTIMTQHEAEIYATELAMVQSLPAAFELQRQQLAEFYKTDITLATFKNSTGGTAPIVAPYMPASDAIPVFQHSDSIRARYPFQAARANLPPVYDMDPISPDDGPTRVWHPGLIVAVPNDLRALYPSLRPSYPVGAGGNWGNIASMPLERYFYQRVGGDLQDIDSTYMRPLDTSRTQTLAAAIRQMLGVPNNLRITGLPATIPDDQREPVIPPPPPPPAPRYDPIYVLPRIIAPANASAQFRQQVTLYNTSGGRFTADTRRLVQMILNYAELLGVFDTFIEDFASDAWESNVHGAALQVLETIGQKKQFMILTTYGLRPVPTWAQPGRTTAAVTTFEYEIVRVAMLDIAPTITQDLGQPVAAPAPLSTRRFSPA